MTQDQISNLLLDLYDIRGALSQNALETLKDDEGTEMTIGDLLDDAIATLEAESKSFTERM